MILYIYTQWLRNSQHSIRMYSAINIVHHLQRIGIEHYKCELLCQSIEKAIESRDYKFTINCVKVSF